jgi:hypothetical protein
VVGPAAQTVVFGGLTYGTGAVWYDDFSLEIAEPGSDRWTAVAIPTRDSRPGASLEAAEPSPSSSRKHASSTG